MLEIKGATLAVYDSWIESDNTESSLDDVLRGAKAVMIVTDHDDVVSGLNGRDLRKDGIEVVIDGRNCLDGENIAGQGVLYRGVGRRA